ncbi:NIPSNAP family protein [Brevibacillus nitrificans]|uniref:NIPSNAP family protein n=1 Tax=Brevibacillus nitrificans TaxID=651560 RepID=UPI002E249A70|nr:NIPSNAP family protein [Brevibacillus nitrificans]
MLYELRIYDVVPGRMQALLDRFQNDAISIFERHGMKVTNFWVDADESKNRLYYVLEHPNLEIRNQNYDRFRNDPEWIEIRRVTEIEGPLVAKQESIFMKNASFFENN